MNNDNPKECVHRISTFQAHSACTKLASICDRKCQQSHTSSIPHSIYNRDDIFQRFGTIMTMINQQIQGYKTKLMKIYQQSMSKFNRQFEKVAEQMQGQIMNSLLKMTKIDQIIINKIENCRIQNIKCDQIYSLMNRDNLERKINQTQLKNIYEKHERDFRNLLDGKENKKNKDVSPNTAGDHYQKSDFEQMVQKLELESAKLNELSAQNWQLKQRLDQISLQLKKQKVKRSDLEFTINKNSRKLKQNTWNILQVKTKKIAKPKNIAQPIQFKQNILMINQSMEIQNPPYQKIASQQPIEKQQFQQDKNAVKQISSIQLLKNNAEQMQESESESQDFVDFTLNKNKI